MNIRHILNTAAAPLAMTAVLAASPAFAQGIDAPVQVASAADDVILVTGSRIAANPETSSANPIVTVDAENILRSGETNLTNLLVQTPALFNSEDNFDAAGSQARSGGAGVNLLDLRNLGPERTLVLVNGRRHVAGISGEAGVDINSIPLALIDRVDVLTGGVSSVYGADGVSGVVNFVMKRDFEGIDARGQYGVSDFGDADSYYGSATIGKNFADDRGNIAVSYEYRREERVAFGDRPNGRFESLQLVRNPDDIPDDPNIVDNILLPFIGFADSSPAGAIAIDDGLASAFRGDGAIYNGGTFLSDSGFLSTGSANTDDTPTADYQGDLQAESEHHNVNLLFSYELTPSINFFAEGKYVDTSVFTLGQPSFDFFTYLPADNAFIPDSISDEITAGNFAGFGLDDGIAFSRDNFDLGTRGETLDRELWRVVAGFDGSISDNANFEISYVHGENKTTYISPNNRIWDRYFAALDAVDEGQFLTGTANGNIVCRSDLNGGAIVPFNILDVVFSGDAPPTTPQTFVAGDGSCQPLNLFGEGVRSQAALDFISVDLANSYTLKQDVVNAFITGDLGKYFELPGGPIAFVLGGEYRKESSASFVDPISQTPRAVQDTKSVLSDLALLANETGSFNVKEVFGELSLPILADVPNAELLEIKAAVRLSDYSTTGFADSWSVSGIWAPLKEVTFRGSYSKATRAPNITELFAPTTGTFEFVTDPCDPQNITSGSSFRAANCEALITGLGVDFDTYNFSDDIASSASVAGGVSGNTNLEQEDATTWTVGLVLQPNWARGLALTLDWYDIRLENAINTATVSELAEFCVDAATLDNQFCDLVQRDNTTGFVGDYQLQPFNVAFFETSGLDVTLSYLFDVGNLGEFSVRGALGYLEKLVFLPSNGGEVNDDRGEVGAPKWNGSADLTWSKDIFSLNYGVRYIGPQLRFEQDILAANPDRAAPELISFSDRFIHDIQGEVAIADDKFTLYAGINNFTNELPDVGSITQPTGWLGRYFFGGVRVAFDGFGF